ncbi:MAG: hypothetical protein B7Z42_07620, partial [Brevundimonas sp. 12-68-7]
MSDTPPTDPKNRPTGAAPGAAAPEPFVRGRIVWGRPPETVFRAGPLPRAPESWSQAAPRPATPPTPTPHPATNIFTGSMIPTRAAPAPEPELPGEKPLSPEPDAADLEAPAEPLVARPRRARKAAAAPNPVATPEIAPAPEPPFETVVEDVPVVEAYAEPEPEPFAEPVLETIVEPDPVRSAAAARPTVEIIVEPEAPEQIDTLPPPLSGAATGPADPRAIPSVVVTPTLYARVEAVMEKVKTNDTWRIAAVAGALIVIAGFVWLATLPAGDAPPLDMDAPPPAAPGAEVLPPVETAPIPATEAPPPAAVQTEAEATPAPTPAPARVEPARPTAPRAAQSTTPSVTTPPVEPPP